MEYVNDCLDALQSRLDLGKSQGAAGLGGLFLGTVFGIHLTLSLSIASFLPSLETSASFLYIVLLWSLYITLLSLFHVITTTPYTPISYTLCYIHTCISLPPPLLKVLLLQYIYPPHPQACIDAGVYRDCAHAAVHCLVPLVHPQPQQGVLGCLPRLPLRVLDRSLLLQRVEAAVRLPERSGSPYAGDGTSRAVYRNVVRRKKEWHIYIITVIRTCGKNFAHQIMVEKAEGHQLITHGVYAYLRHPSYFGFFYWSVGSQLFLLNPICLILYTLASWRFFKDRIPYEESLLLQCYGEDYLNYMKKTIIGIPLIPTIRDRFR